MESSKTLFNLAALACVAVGMVSGQDRIITPGTVVRSGHVWDRRATVVSPGQVLTLFVHNVGRSITNRMLAQGVPLPTTMAGISVDFVRGAESVLAPIFSVIPLEECFETRYCDRQLALTILIPNAFGGGIFFLENLPRSLRVKENGEVRALVSIGVMPQTPRIFTRNDAIGENYPDLVERTAATVRHLDGSGVLPSSPAKPGEIVKFYATGLGMGWTASQMGEFWDSDAPVAMEYEFGVLRRPKRVEWDWGKPLPGNGFVSAKSIPDKIGFYEIRFRVPETMPENTPPCFGQRQYDGNLMVSIGWTFGGGSSASTFTDAVEFCVEVPTATPPPLF